jgi:hypothetical protein
MAVEGINTKTWRQWGTLVHTSEVFIPPQSALVTSALVGTIGDGRSWCGIVEVKRHLIQGVPDTIEKFSDFYWLWPPAVGRMNMSSVTCAMTTYDDSQSARALFTLFLAGE